MQMNEIENYYFFDFDQLIVLEGQTWSIQQSSKFKKGLRKYSHDQRVMDALKSIQDSITSGRVTTITDFPPEYNVHRLTDKKWNKALWAHLKGQKIGLIFKADPATKVISYIFIGTHQGAGFGKRGK